MRLLYDLIFLIISLVYLPGYLSRRKFRRSFFTRLGVLPKGLDLTGPIWIHAVSVGEAMAVKGLVEELRNAYPGKKLVISTVTDTGNRIAAGIAGGQDFITYLPLDFSFTVRSVMDKVSPALFIIAETEIWPNLITCLHKKKIPVVLVNGRISDESFRGYACLKFLLKPVLGKVSLFCVQSDRDAQRFMRLGVSKNRIRVTGNMKFDTTDYTDKKNTDYAVYRKRLGLGVDEKFLVSGSTHQGEEEIVLGAYKELKEDMPSLRLMLAPRHPERATQIENLIIRHGFAPLLISRLTHNSQLTTHNSVFILDTIGELLNFYAIADIVFVGGSLIKKGGQNILEPASLSKPVLFGPYMFNFRDIAELFLNNKAAVVTRNQEELRANIKYLLDNPQQLAYLGRLAKETVLKNQGATKRTLELIKRLQVS